MMNKKLLWALCIVFIAAVGMRFNMSMLAWVKFVPLFLLAFLGLSGIRAFNHRGYFT